jgi:hypothetical protein
MDAAGPLGPNGCCRRIGIDEDPIVTERRHHARRRVCLGGRARVAAFLPEVDCTVRDVSLEGAGIRVAPDVILPERFDLIIPCRNETRRVFVAWRSGASVGLGFDATRSDTTAERAAHRLATSEAEVARLRAALLRGNRLDPDRVH